MYVFIALFIGIPTLGHAYFAPPEALLGLALDPDLDPLVMEQMQEEGTQPTDEAEPTWEEDTALWQAANDPLVLDEQIFDENGNWIENADTSVNFAEFVDQQAPVEEIKEEPVPAPATVQTTTMAPSTTSNGKPVLYRGGKVFDPGTGVHAAAEEEPMQEPPMEEAVVVEEEAEVPSDTTGESGTGDTVIVEEDAMTGAVLEDAEALTATGALEAGEEAEADKMPVGEEEEESWLSGTLMTVALAGGAIALGVVLLVFKGKAGGMRRKTNTTAPTAAATDVPAAPAPEESKLQQAIDEMREKQ